MREVENQPQLLLGSLGRESGEQVLAIAVQPDHGPSSRRWGG
jgi:hypothetical protein